MGVTPHVIPPWETKPSSLPLLSKRARCCDGLSGHINIFPQQLCFKPLTLEELGRWATPFDTIFVSVIKGGVLINDLRFLPPSLVITSETSIKVMPDRVCPRLPLVDLNKNKDSKKYRNQQQWPKPTCFNPDFGNEPEPEADLDFLWHASKEGEAKEDEAMTFWERHMWECEQQASSSGLSLEEKLDTITVNGRSSQCYRPVYRSDILGLPLRSTEDSLFSSNGYMSACSSNDHFKHLGKRYPWDVIFAQQQDPLPLDYVLPRDQDEEGDEVVSAPAAGLDEAKDATMALAEDADLAPPLIAPISFVHPAPNTELSIVVSNARTELEASAESFPHAASQPQVPLEVQAYVHSAIESMFGRFEALLKIYFPHGPPPPPPPSS